MYNEAQKRATLKYLEKNYKKITLSVRKEVKERYAAEAEKRGVNLTQFILSCVEKEIGG